MADDQSPLGGPLELPGGEPPHSRSHGKLRRFSWPVKKILIVIVALVVLALIGWGLTKIFHKKKSSTSTSSASQSQTSQPSTKATDVPEVAGTKTYNSTALGVILTYPVGWTLNETDGGIRIESPDFNYTTTDKGSVTGNFRVYIRKGARDVDSKYIGRGVAIMPSAKLAYTAPTSTQRKETNLSFFGLDTPNQFAYFLVAGNFNLVKGDTLGPNYGKEADTFLVTGGYSAKSLTDDFATNQVTTDFFQQTNAYKQAIDILKSLQLQ